MNHECPKIRYLSYVSEMKHLILLFAFIAVVASANLFRAEWNDDWKAYKETYRKSFRSMTEERSRRTIWEARRTKIEQHNAEAKLGKHTYTLGINRFSDWTEEELSGLTNAELPSTMGSDVRIVPSVRSRNRPHLVDLRDECMPQVKDQGPCGSCWAFASTPPFEYALCKKTGELQLLSEQQLVDCSTSHGNGGCSGGWYWTSWQYVIDAMGQMNSTTYPYTAQDQRCKYCPSEAVGTISSYYRIGPLDVATIESLVASGNPVAIAFQAQGDFVSYGGGIYDDPTCPNDMYTLNHAVVIVGYGVTEGIPHWIVRNSWGTGWGAGGYIYMRRGVNLCNMETWAAYLVV